MSKTKVFLISFFATLAVLAPLYAAVHFFGKTVTKTQFVGQSQSGVFIAQPTTADAHTLLLLTGNTTAQEATSFVLIKFDAYKNTISVSSMPPETIVLSKGEPVTLTKAVTLAGPAQAVEALSETLNISIQNYAFTTPKTLWQMAEKFGNVSLRLSNYLTETELEALGLNVTNSSTQTVSPRLFAQILETDTLSATNLYALRSVGYCAFLTAGHGSLKSTLPTTLRSNTNSVATNFTATELIDYERILQFLDRQEPTYTAKAMSGTWNSDASRFELDETSLSLAQEFFT